MSALSATLFSLGENRFILNICIITKQNFKDARSVSLYPYNRSKIWQYINYATQINIAKGIANIVTNNAFLNKK